jgi:hypothetical protein
MPHILLKKWELTIIGITGSALLVAVLERA